MDGAADASTLHTLFELFFDFIVHRVLIFVFDFSVSIALSSITNVLIGLIVFVSLGRFLLQLDCTITVIQRLVASFFFVFIWLKTLVGVAIRFSFVLIIINLIFSSLQCFRQRGHFHLFVVFPGLGLLAATLGSFFALSAFLGWLCGLRSRLFGIVRISRLFLFLGCIVTIGFLVLLATILDFFELFLEFGELLLILVDDPLLFLLFLRGSLQFTIEISDLHIFVADILVEGPQSRLHIRACLGLGCARLGPFS